MHRTHGIEVRAEATGGALVVCIGNSLAGDDAVGPIVFNRLVDESLPPRTQLVSLGLGGLSLLEYFRAQSVAIIVDAVQLGGDAGRIHVLEADSIPQAKAQAVSLHGIGLRETLNIAKSLYPETLPARIVLIGVEGRSFTELGVPPCYEVQTAVESVVDEIKQQLANSTYVVCS